MSFFTLFLGSFHSADIYRRLRAKNDFLIGYTFVVVVLTTLFVTLYYGTYIHRELFVSRNGKPPVFDDAVRQIAGQLPPMTLMNHQLQTADPVPTIIYFTGEAFGLALENEPIATIDTGGTASHDTVETPILVTYKDVYIKGDRKTEVKSISEFTEGAPSTVIMNRAWVSEKAESLIAITHASLWTFYFILGGFAWVFMMLYMFFMRLVMVLVLGLVGLAIAGITKTQLTYTQTVGLAALSYTPIAVLDTLIFTLLSYTTNSLVLLFAGAVALFAAIKASGTPDPNARIG